MGNTNKTKNICFSNKTLDILLDKNVDYCFSFGSHILFGKLLEIYKNKIINFHPAILPMFPGVRALDQALEAGNVLLVGNTAHFITDKVDMGPIIMHYANKTF